MQTENKQNQFIVYGNHNEAWVDCDRTPLRVSAEYQSTRLIISISRSGLSKSCARFITVCTRSRLTSPQTSPVFTVYCAVAGTIFGTTDVY